MKLRLIKAVYIIISFLFTSFIFTSCQKEQSQSEQDAQEVEASRISGESESEAETVFNGVFDDAMGVNDEVGIGGTGVFGRLNVCPTVTITRPNLPDLFPVRVEMDFGANGCIGPDGHFRKGKVITVYTKRLLIPGAVAETSFDGFYVDSVHVEGTHKITNISTVVTAGTPPVDRKFRVVIINGKLTKPNGNYISWNSEKTISQVEGLGTILPMDDIFKIEGGSRGQVKRGNLLVGFNSNITEPLMKRFNCRWIAKGIVKTVRLNASTNSPWVATLNFGIGNCDNLAVLTINGVSYQITLP
ncbi:MAG TPA: hypothetical protein PLU11_06555 [Chitinophagaceae bacterium]|nr:hypothetical protein [Chitinophagaceae bacterium]HPH30893.1 hypothetical protein [Chitinophagaceae bacterium]HPN58813.1 hypothetical protein [Chitinophagaceae bacterium]